MFRLCLLLVVAVTVFGTQHAAAQSLPSPVCPGEAWLERTPAELGLDADKLQQARDYALTGEGSGMIVRRGYAVLRWGDQQRQYDLKSTTKSIGAMALGVAVLDGKVRLDDPAVKHHPSFGIPPESNRDTPWLERITLRHLATHTAGFEKPGGYAKLVFEPGTKWQYSDSGPNWLAECLTLVYRRSMSDLMFERVLTPIGVTKDDFRWRRNQYRDHEIEGLDRNEFGAGVHANVEALARIGYLHLRGGEWNGQRLLPAEFVAEAGSAAKSIQGLPVVQPEDYGRASRHYGLLWWNNADGTLDDVPRDAYWSWGLYDSLIVVIPSLDLVVARAGESWKRNEGADHYDVLEPFLGPLCEAVTAAQPAEAQPAGKANDIDAPYPPSPVIAGIDWAPADTIIRLAPGSDNWPITWAADDWLYTAYGDGRGFEPFVPRKLSLGLCRVAGMPPDIRGENLRAPTAEAIGDGNRARKASGMLALDDGTLYMLVRNVSNSQLGWSTDHGRTWQWADWKFDISFGCPTFLNFGQAYSGSRDDYVYVFSHDHDSAYERADRFILARVPKDRLRERAAYEFFVRRGDDGSPQWTKSIDERGAVFEHAGQCYRSGISYSAALKRYLWWPDRRGKRYAVRRRAGHLRRAAALGTVDDGLFHADVGRGVR